MLGEVLSKLGRCPVVAGKCGVGEADEAVDFQAWELMVVGEVGPISGVCESEGKLSA